jgi:hypothetical protein
MCAPLADPAIGGTAKQIEGHVAMLNSQDLRRRCHTDLHVETVILHIKNGDASQAAVQARA